VKPDLDVAATLECEPELLPYLPEILQDFDELGSDPQRLIECLEAECVADGIRNALDLCCGKGATSIALAKRFGMRVDGIDAIDAFLASARAAAADAGVDELCRFATGDLCAVVTQRGSYDLVIFASVGPILGGITKTVTHLMTPLRSGGWILIDDSVLLPGAPDRPGFEAHAQLEETRRRVEMSGAEIVAMRSSGSDARGHDSDMQRIVRRAAALVKRQPDLAPLVARYVERQRGECAFLERWTRDVTWLLGKPPARETAR
jgi:trans-aconitate methyltransferase